MKRPKNKKQSMRPMDGWIGGKPEQYNPSPTSHQAGHLKKLDALYPDHSCAFHVASNQMLLQADRGILPEHRPLVRMAYGVWFLCPSSKPSR